MIPLMHPLWPALLGPWEWRPAVLLTLVPLTLLYLVGWLRLRRRGATKLASGWRLAAYLAGMGTLWLSLLSPVDRLGGQLFFMHMIQHKLSIMVAAPLLWLGNPFPVGVWGLPRAARRAVAGLFNQEAPLRAPLATATQPFVAWLLFVFVYIGWHDPGAYDAALRSGWVHDIQHITFFVTALLFWWHIVGAAPRLHRSLSPWVAIAMLIGVIPFNAITGFVIANADAAIYTYYESVPRIWGFSVLEDQALGGVIMWIPGSEMFFQAAGLLLALLFVRERRKSRRLGQASEPLSGALLPDDALIAPGLEHRALQNKWRDAAALREQARHGASS